MTLGQLCDYKTALKYYHKGLDLFLKELKTTHDELKINNMNNSIAGTYATLAEMYMNTDLCNEANAEELCENYLVEAIKYDKDSFDALIQYSNLRILRARDNEALEYMEKIYTYLLKAVENGNADLPSLDIIANLAKNYSELEIYAKAIKVYDVLIVLDDENVY
jgi:tetratricopeptide (TPR) repeat protein